MTDVRVGSRPTDADADTDPGRVRLRMDPRIRERRVAVKRDEGRRRLRLLVGAGVLVTAVATAYGVTRSPLTDVDQVTIRGATFTSPALVNRAAGLGDRPQLADVDPVSAVRSLEKLPWVQTATLTRHWPGSVAVVLVERAPLATLAAAGGGWALVDRTGRVLDVQPEAPPGMAIVVGPSAPAPGSTVDTSNLEALQIVDALPASMSQLLQTVTVNADETLTLGLQGIPTVEFGRAEQVRPKLVALSTLLARTNLKGVRSIDVRAPTAPVLTRP